MKNRFKLPLKMGGKQRILTFSNNFWYLLHEKNENDFGQLVKNIGTKHGTIEQVELITDVFQSALEATDRSNQEYIEYDRFLLRDWIDGLKQEDTAKVVNMMFLSKGIDVKALDKEVKKMKQEAQPTKPNLLQGLLGKFTKKQ